MYWFASLHIRVKKIVEARGGEVERWDFLFKEFIGPQIPTRGRRECVDILPSAPFVRRCLSSLTTRQFLTRPSFPNGQTVAHHSSTGPLWSPSRPRDRGISRDISVARHDLSTTHSTANAPTSSFPTLPLLPPPPLQRLIPLPIHRQHTPMPQIRRKPRPTARCPPAVTPRVPTLVRPIPVGAVKVQQQMRPARDRVVPVRGGALDARLDHGRVAAGPGPRTEEPRGGDLDEDGLFGFVLHEAEEGVGGGAVDGQNG